MTKAKRLLPKFFRRCSLLINSIAAAIDCIHCLFSLSQNASSITYKSQQELLILRLKDCCERLLLMSLSFYHTLAFSSPLSFLFKLFLISSQLILSSELIISQSVKLPFQQFRKPLPLFYPAKSPLMDKKLVVASQRQLKSGQVSVQLIASLWQVYQLARQVP